MSKHNRQIEEAMELALSCRICKGRTDAKYNKESNTWVTYCDCGKRDEHNNSDILKEAGSLIRTIPKRRK